MKIVHKRENMNQSKSTYGVLRGLHLQLGEYAQAKLVRAIAGKILDSLNLSHQLFTRWGDDNQEDAP